MNLKPKNQHKPWFLNVKCQPETQPETQTRNLNPKSQHQENNDTHMSNLSGTRSHDVETSARKLNPKLKPEQHNKHSTLKIPDTPPSWKNVP